VGVVHLNKSSMVMHGSMIVLCLVCEILILRQQILLALGIPLFLGVLALMFAWSEVGTLLVICAIYANLPVLAVQLHGASPLVASVVVLLLAVPLVRHLIIGRERLIIDQPLLLILAFVMVAGVSAFFAQDKRLALERIGIYVQEGLVLYLLIINVVRKLTTLRRVVWVLMLTGGFLGALSLYQSLTHSYDQPLLGGLARMSDDVYVDFRGKRLSESRYDSPHSVPRVSGPLDHTNHYARVLLLLFPLALFRFWGERSRALRLGAAAAAGCILCGIVLTYSRGAFVALTCALFMLLCMRYIRLSRVLSVLAVLGLLAMFFLPTSYVVRMATLRGIKGLFSDEVAVSSDGAVLGRATQMLAAMRVFLAYPILGVGPGQYTPFYSEKYNRDPQFAFKEVASARGAHSLYLQMAAETGIIGLTAFMAIVLLILRRLWQARRHWVYSHPEGANLVTALFLGLTAFFIHSVFANLTYERYLFLFLALAGAAVQIWRSEIPPTPGVMETRGV
jgi:putative inorganic carbon (hco3(-)) transporter